MIRQNKEAFQFWTTKNYKNRLCMIFSAVIGVEYHNLSRYWGIHRVLFDKVCVFFRLVSQLIKFSNFSSFQRLGTNSKKLAMHFKMTFCVRWSISNLTYETFFRGRSPLKDSVLAFLRVFVKYWISPKWHRVFIILTFLWIHVIRTWLYHWESRFSAPKQQKFAVFSD